MKNSGRWDVPSGPGPVAGIRAFEKFERKTMPSEFARAWFILSSISGIKELPLCKDILVCGFNVASASANSDFHRAADALVGWIPCLASHHSEEERGPIRMKAFRLAL